MGLIIPDEILKSARLSEQEFKIEVALMLYQLNRITLAQGSRYLNISQLDFQAILSDRKIPVHYSVSDLQDDMQTLQELNL